VSGMENERLTKQREGGKEGGWEEVAKV
jgi:hypothetical protein